MRKLILLICVLLWPGLATAGYDEAVTAYKNDDFKTALKEFQKLAKQGNAKAQTNIGVMYGAGQGVPQDYKKAMEWYRKAAAQGNAEAQTNIGMMYGTGQGVPQDYVQAVEWYRKAAAQGDAIAQTNLGGLYYNGQGVPQDYAQAMEWCRKAAVQGKASSQYHLGVMYLFGQGVPQDYERAFEWTRKAAEQGIVDAQNNLGMMYRNGDGTQQDYVLAYKWANLAAASGDMSGIKLRDDLVSRMTASQLEEGQRLTREGAATHTNANLIQQPKGTSIEFAGGNGKTLETAIVINGVKRESDGVSAEYFWLNKNLPNFKKRMQATISEANRKYDKFELLLPDGTVRDVYFDITSFYGKGSPFH